MAQNFDGSGEYYYRSVALTTRDNWTLSAWINIDTLPQNNAMIVYNGEDGGGGPYNGYGFLVAADSGGSGSKLVGLYGGIAWKNSGYTFSSTGVWYHVVMTRNSGTLRFYVNGTDVGYSNTDADNGTPSGSFSIACQDRNSEGFVSYFDGKVAEVAAWDRALGTGEIASLADGFSPAFFPIDLEAYMPLIVNGQDRANSGTVTAGGTPDTTNHPRIIYPSTGLITPLTANVTPPTTSITYVTTVADTSDTTTYTFSSASLGAAHDDRMIIVGIHSRKAGAVSSISSVSVGGVSATIVLQNWNTITNSNVAAIAIAAVPTGTTGDIVVTFADTMLRCAVGIWRAFGIELTAYDSDSSDASDPTVNLDVPAGFVIAVATTNASTSTTWTGVTENYDTVLETFVSTSGGFVELESLESGRTITADFAAPGTESAGVFASWEWSSETPATSVKDIIGMGMIPFAR
jgi:hypothetical protein